MRRLLLILVALTFSSSASAYCRTHTCEVEPEGCEVDENGCNVSGLPIAWKSTCLSYAVERTGSPAGDISPEDTESLVASAFDVWTSADCGDGGTPPIFAQSQGEAVCDVPEYNCGDGDPNSNVIMFRDDGWPYERAALAITTVSFDPNTGRIWDADMELNSAGFDFKLPGETGTDLLSTITHEAGHMLGLDHSNVSDATMYDSYSPNSQTIRDLDEDDAAGICEIYGSEPEDPECRAVGSAEQECLGSTECDAHSTGSCSVVLSKGQGRGTTPLPLLLLGIGIVLRRRRAKPTRRSALNPSDSR